MELVVGLGWVGLGLSRRDFHFLVSSFVLTANWFFGDAVFLARG